jgi:site-specific DNA recombinase
MRVICYVRVSTREQAEKGYSVGEQQERLRAYCIAKDWIVEDVITDPGFSGAKLERPGIQRVIRLVQEKKCEAVLVWKLDRLSRSQKDTLYLIEDVFLKNGCAFVSMNENFDTSTAFGRAMIGILSVFAQLEREQIRERMAVGRVGRAKAGLFHGGGFAPIGYDYKTIAEGGEGLVVNEYEAMQVREVFSLYLQGWPVNRIRKYMTARYTTKSGDWGNDTTIRDVLKNPLYIGKINWAKKIYDGKHEPIIDEETFNAAAARLASSQWKRDCSDGLERNSPFHSTHLLGGILWCGRCGARYFASGNYSGKGENRKYWPYYVCYSRAKSAKRMIRDPNCKNDRWPVAKLDKIILDQVRQLIFDPEALERAAGGNQEAPPSERRALLNARRAEAKGQIDRLLDLCQMGTLPAAAVADRLKSLQDEVEGIDTALRELAEDDPAERLEAARETLVGAAEILDNGSLDEKRELVHSLIHRIDLDGENIDIHWSFAPGESE